MVMIHTTNSHEAGFSLIEISVIITVFAVLLASLLGGRVLDKQTSRMVNSNATLDVVEDALLFYYLDNGFLPCPAARNLSPNQPGHGTLIGQPTNCNAAVASGLTDEAVSGADQYRVRIGAIPTRALGISDTYAYDAWGNYINYAVMPELAINDVRFKNFTPVQAGNFLQLVNSANGQIIYGNDMTEMIGYLLFSAGPDAKGAFSRLGQLAVNCDVSGGEIDNDNCNNADGSKRFITRPINDSVSGTGYYYDLVRWQSKEYLDAL